MQKQKRIITETGSSASAFTTDTAGILFVCPARIHQPDMFDNHRFGGDELQLSARFAAHNMQGFSACRAYLLFLGQGVIYDFHGQVRRKRVTVLRSLLLEMLLHDGQFRLDGANGGRSFSFVEEIYLVIFALFAE